MTQPATSRENYCAKISDYGYSLYNSMLADQRLRVFGKIEAALGALGPLYNKVGGNDRARLELDMLLASLGKRP